jgi:hypothetical protein
MLWLHYIARGGKFPGVSSNILCWHRILKNINFASVFIFIYLFACVCVCDSPSVALPLYEINIRIIRNYFCSFQIFGMLCEYSLELYVPAINQSRLASSRSYNAPGTTWRSKASSDLHVFISSHSIVVCFRVFVLCCGLFSLKLVCRCYVGRSFKFWFSAQVSLWQWSVIFDAIIWMKVIIHW